MSNKIARNVAIGVGCVGAAYMVIPRNSKPLDTFASQNVTDKFSSGGASKTHTPGVATPKGNPEDVTSNQMNPKGIDTQHFKDNHASQKIDGSSGAPFGATLNKASYGHEKGK